MKFFTEEEIILLVEVSISPGWLDDSITLSFII